MEIALLVFFALTVALNVAVIFDIIYDIVVARCKEQCPPISANFKFGTPRSRE